MEMAKKTKERSTVILAVLTLVVIGVTILLYTTQSFRHQREAEEQHLYLTSRAVFLSTERYVKRGPVREGGKRLSPRLTDFFQALEQDGDVMLVGIIDETGGELLTSSTLRGTAPIIFPTTMVTELFAQGEWHGRMMVDKQVAYVYGKRLEPLPGGMHTSVQTDATPPGFLVVGLDLERHLVAYAGFRKNLIFQMLYILAAVIITWSLGIRFLSRREQAQKAVRLELFQSKLLDNLPDGLITLAPDGTVQSANPAALHILQRDSKDVLGKPATDLPAGLSCCLAKNASGWQRISYGRASLEALALPIENDPESACLVIIRDRTQLYTLEKSLADAEKLAAVGSLAAGVAHEVRNPLSSLRGFAQYFVKKLSGKMPEEEYAKTMVREADRLNRVITDLLFLGRPKPIEPRMVALAPLIQEITTLMKFDLEQLNITIDVSLGAPSVYADEDALKQALINLVLNSLDALQEKEERGKNADCQAICSVSSSSNYSAAEQNASPASPVSPASSDPSAVEMEPLPLSSGDAEQAQRFSSPASTTEQPAVPDLSIAASLRIRSGFAMPEQLPRQSDMEESETAENARAFDVWIDVEDLGCGMNEEQQHQAFEAFFTAKARGTGLGLALVKRTMMDHSGKALIASAPMKGCTVRLLFPPPNGAAEATAPLINVSLDDEKSRTEVQQ